MMQNYKKTKTSAAFPGLPTEMVFKIISHLDDRTLLSCRLVSKGWCEASSKYLRSRSTIIVRPWCPPSLNIQDSLSNLTNCFKLARKSQRPFPFTNFILRGFDGDVSDCPDLEPFFARSKQPRSGLMIKCLRFDGIKPNQAFMSNLEEIIFEKTPQLKILSVHFDCDARAQPAKEAQAWIKKNIYGSQSSGNLAVLEPTISSLQVLQMDCCVGGAASEFVTKILGAAPNLKRIEGTNYSGFQGFQYHVYHPDHLQALIDTKKLHLVDQCLIHLTEQVVVSGVLAAEKLDGFKPKMLSLRLESFSNNSRSAWIRNLDKTKSGLGELLWVVKDSVEELWADKSLGLLDRFDLPGFSKLKRLRWELFSAQYPILQRGMKGQDIFPVLEEMSLRLPSLIAETGIMPELGQIPVFSSVHTLEIQARASFTKEFLESVKIMCPNLRTLKLSHFPNSIFNFGRVGPHIWKVMKGLKVLILDNELLWRRNSLEYTEAAFTGFSVEAVRRIQDAKLEEHEVLLRVNYSILKMKELKKLIIYVDPVSMRTRGPDLHLSFKYAFDLMPGLTVEVPYSTT